MGNLLKSVSQKVRNSRFENYSPAYALLYLMMIAPPRAFDIKHKESTHNGELASLPTYCVVSIELFVRVACVLILAAGIEMLLGNTLYETHRIDTFFCTVVSAGAIHSGTFYLIFNAGCASDISSSLLLLYRLVRNSCYAILTGFISVVPVFIWRFDHELPPFSDGVAVQAYLCTAGFFLIAGLIEAKFASRLPLGGRIVKKTESHSPYSAGSTATE